MPGASALSAVPWGTLKVEDATISQAEPEVGVTIARPKAVAVEGEAAST